MSLFHICLYVIVNLCNFHTFIVISPSKTADWQLKACNNKYLNQRMSTIYYCQKLLVNSQSLCNNSIGLFQTFIYYVIIISFLDACSRLYDKVCWSVGRSVGRSVVPILPPYMSEGLAYLLWEQSNK